MERLQHGTEPESARVTGEEARRMVELWSQTADPSAPAGLDLRDVAEALGIPEPEAAALLARVRAESPALAPPAPEPVTVLLTMLLALSLMVSTVSVFILGGSLVTGGHFEPLDALALFAALAWTLLWLHHFRRPVARGLADTARRLAQPHR